MAAGGVTAVHTPPVEYFVVWTARDHLYRQCPAYQRSKRHGTAVEGTGERWVFHLPDPNGDLCGWCTRLWLQRNPDAAPCPGADRCRVAAVGRRNTAGK